MNREQPGVNHDRKSSHVSSTSVLITCLRMCVDPRAVALSILLFSFVLADFCTAAYQNIFLSFELLVFKKCDKQNYVKSTYETFLKNGSFIIRIDNVLVPSNRF